MDAPLAPKLLGGVVGHALAEGVLPVALLTELASPIESAEPRRAFVVESLKAFKVAVSPMNSDFVTIAGMHIVQMGMQKAFEMPVQSLRCELCKREPVPHYPKTCVATVAQAEADAEKLQAGTAELELDTLLAADPELDPPDLPSVADLLAAEGLA